MKRLLVGLALALALAAPAVASVEPAPLGSQPFWWGVTLAGYQNDGGMAGSDWYDYEKTGVLPERSGRGADFRGHMDEDLDHAQSLGLNAFRTSIEWARLEPREGYYDPAEVAYVHRLLNGLKKRGMAPVITLYHFATPEWADVPDENGLAGWESPRMVAAFERYVDFVAREFGKDIAAYLTFNEPSSVLLGGYMTGFIPPHRWGALALARATRNILLAHEQAYDIIHARQPNALVSCPDYNCLLPVLGGVDWTPGRWFAQALPTETDWDGRKRPRYLDFVTVHYYGTNHAFSSYPIQPWRWSGNPQHLEHILRVYQHAFHLPILIAENGFATEDHKPRADGWTRESYLVSHIAAIEHARAQGVPVMGYMYWTLTDNYEWGSYTPRFGLWSVECRSGDLTRHETPAAAVYREIVHHNGVTPELLRRYPPPGTAAAAARTPG